MDIEKTIKSLEKNGYTVSYFETAADAVNYLEKTIEGKTICFGGSRTLQDLNLKEIVSRKNKVYDPDHPDDDKGFREIAAEGITADLFSCQRTPLAKTAKL